MQSLYLKKLRFFTISVRDKPRINDFIFLLTGIKNAYSSTTLLPVRIKQIIKGVYMPRITKRIVRNNKGQGIMEYIILSGLIGIFCLVAVKSIGTKMKTRLNQIEKRLNTDIQIAR